MIITPEANAYLVDTLNAYPVDDIKIAEQSTRKCLIVTVQLICHCTKKLTILNTLRADFYNETTNSIMTYEKGRLVVRDALKLCQFD